MPTKTTNNVVSLLARAANAVGGKPALVMPARSGGEQTLSFDQLWDRVDRTSVGLRHAGLRVGDRVIIMIPMSMDLYVGLLAVLKLGAVAVFVDPWIGRRQIAAFCAFANASAWLGIPKSHLLRLIDPTLRKIPLTITTGRRWFGLGGRFTFKALQRESGDGEIANVADQDTAMITFTSGSSGLPKGVNRTHGFLMAQHQALQQEFPQREEDIDMPMFPVFALNNLARGIPSVVPQLDFRYVDRADGEVLTAQMRRQNTTTCTASPPFLDRLAEFQQRHSVNRTTLAANSHGWCSRK